MSVMELLTTRPPTRRFAQKAVPQDVVDDIVQAVRLSSCGANRQAVRLVLVQSPEMVAKVQPLVIGAHASDVYARLRQNCLQTLYHCSVYLPSGAGLFRLCVPMCGRRLSSP